MEPTSAEVNAPVGVVYVNGNIFLLENGGQRVRQISSSGTITTAGGTGGPGGITSGVAAGSAKFNYAQGLAVDPT